MRPVGKIEHRDYSKDYCRSAFNDEKPSPSREAQPIDSKKQPRERRPHEVRQRPSRHEERYRFRPVLIAKPVSQINDDPRIEARFRRAKPKPQPVELSHWFRYQDRAKAV